MRIRWEIPAKHHPQWGNHDLLPSDQTTRDEYFFYSRVEFKLKDFSGLETACKLGVESPCQVAKPFSKHWRSPDGKPHLT